MVINPRLKIRPYLNSLLVDGPGVGDPVDFGGSFDVDVEHGVPLPGAHRLRGPFIDGHGMAGQTVLLFQLGVQEVDSWRATTGWQSFVFPLHP